MVTAFGEKRRNCIHWTMQSNTKRRANQCTIWRRDAAAPSRRGRSTSAKMHSKQSQKADKQSMLASGIGGTQQDREEGGCRGHGKHALDNGVDGRCGWNGCLYNMRTPRQDMQTRTVAMTRWKANNGDDNQTHDRTIHGIQTTHLNKYRAKGRALSIASLTSIGGPTVPKHIDHNTQLGKLPQDIWKTTSSIAETVQRWEQMNERENRLRGWAYTTKATH